MKIRKGYISNSSSSSFVIIGKQVLYKEIKEGDLIYVKGREMNDGDDIFELTEDIKAVMDEWDKRRFDKFVFYKSRMSGQEYNSFLTDIVIEEGDELIELDKDYHSTIGIKDFEMIYDDDYFGDEEEEEYMEGGRYIAIIGNKIEDIGEIKGYENIWCNVVIKNKFYMIKIKGVEDIKKCKENGEEIEFYEVRDICDKGYRFHKGHIDKEYIYLIYEDKRIEDIKEIGEEHEENAICPF